MWFTHHHQWNLGQDAWRLESGAYASKHRMQAVVQLAVLAEKTGLGYDVANVVSKWTYLLIWKNTGDAKQAMNCGFLYTGSRKRKRERERRRKKRR